MDHLQEAAAIKRAAGLDTAFLESVRKLKPGTLIEHQQQGRWLLVSELILGTDALPPAFVIEQCGTDRRALVDARHLHHAWKVIRAEIDVGGWNIAIPAGIEQVRVNGRPVRYADDAPERRWSDDFKIGDPVISLGHRGVVTSVTERTVAVRFDGSKIDVPCIGGLSHDRAYVRDSMDAIDQLCRRLGVPLDRRDPAKSIAAMQERLQALETAASTAQRRAQEYAEGVDRWRKERETAPALLAEVQVEE